MGLDVITAYLFGLLLLYLIARILVIPLRWFVRLLVNGIVGGVLLAAFNFVGTYFELYLAINPITALVVGFLGIPGIVLLLALRYLVLGASG